MSSDNLKNNLANLNNSRKLSVIDYVKENIQKINQDSIIYNTVNNQLRKLKKNNVIYRTIDNEIHKRINNLFSTYEHLNSNGGTSMGIITFIITIIIIIYIISYFSKKNI
jgi:chaperonin cofactor prefoldin